MNVFLIILTNDRRYLLTIPSANDEAMKAMMRKESDIFKLFIGLRKLNRNHDLQAFISVYILFYCFIYCFVLDSVQTNMITTRRL